MKQTSFAIGCLVQWYEIEIYKEYLDTLIQAVGNNKDDIIIDICLVVNQDLEKISDETSMLTDIMARYLELSNKYQFQGYRIDYRITSDLVTIADYRREFNDKYCEKVDLLIWGETDMLVPKQMFTSLNILHQNVETPKYLATFSICKMWDKSWEVLEHPEFTDKPFIENDYDNWWSLKYTMTADEMNNINDKYDDLGVIVTPNHKFNGCGLVISSEVIKAGVNIPKSVFFVHEDTAFMLMTNKVLGNIPQYIIKNILVVHNRNHTKKRMYIKGEREDGSMNQKRRSNEWYSNANKMCEQNCYNIFNPNYKSFTWKDVWNTV
jgi:hypothetical protein